MRRIITLAFAALLAAAASPGAASGPALPPKGAPRTGPSLEVLYVPSGDLSRAPGYAPEGAFLPLADLVELARLAREASESHPVPGEEEPVREVFVRRMELSGRLDETLELEGTLAYEAPSAEWTATPVAGGSGLDWLSFEAPEGASARLARLGDRTYLFAKGPESGELRLKAQALPNMQGSAAAMLDLGRFFAPARLEIAFREDFAFESATVPASEPPAAEGAEPRAILWPTADGQAASLLLRRKPQVTVSRDLGFALTRVVAAEGAALEIGDQLVFRGRFAPDGVIAEIPAPEGLRLLRAELAPGSKKAAVRVREGVLKVVALEEARQVGVQAWLAVDKRAPDGSAILGSWDVPAAAQGSAWILKSSEDWTPALVERPEGLAPAMGGTANGLAYEAWGPLPPVRVALAPSAPSKPPLVASTFALELGEARARCQVELPAPNPGELAFQAPEGWLVSGFRVSDARGNGVGHSAQRREGNRWLVAWGDSYRQSPLEASFVLERSGDWGAPGESAAIEAPFVRFEGPRPDAYDMAISWGESLEARAAELSEAAILPNENLASMPNLAQCLAEDAGAANAGQLDAQYLNDYVQSNYAQNAYVQQQAVEQQYFQARQLLNAPPPSISAAPRAMLILRAGGSDPRALMEVKGRESDMRAGIVMTLSVGEDRATVRALLDFTARFAPASVFRFALPAGTGENVKIQAPGQREAVLKQAPGRDEWTVVAQEAVLGNYRVQLEWTLPDKPGEGPVRAPELMALDVTSQRGFIIVEGSETLRLGVETRNMAEVELHETPPTPWPREHRALAAYRYVAPPFSLAVTADKFQPEEPLDGFVRLADLATAFNPDGRRFTKADYRFAPTRDKQFMEIELPVGATLWGAMVNGRGEKPARRPGAQGSAERLLLPLPATAAGGGDARVTLLYEEVSAPLEGRSEISLEGPKLPVPIHKTEWELQLPADFEYLAFGGAMADQKSAAAKPALTWLREAEWPRLVIVPNMSGKTLLWMGFIGVALAFGWSMAKNNKIAIERAEWSPEETKQARGCMTLAELLIVIAIISILASIATPNFLQAQVRSKVSRVLNDLRTVTSALEGYAVDNNAYPRGLDELTAPIQYLTSVPDDPYAPSAGTSLNYMVGWDAARRARMSGAAGYIAPNQEQNFWLVYSVGPDGMDNGATISYDPTNGTVSPGDVIKIPYGFEPPRNYSSYSAPSYPTQRSWSSRRSSWRPSFTLIGFGLGIGAAVLIIGLFVAWQKLQEKSKREVVWTAEEPVDDSKPSKTVFAFELLLVLVVIVVLLLGIFMALGKSVQSQVGAATQKMVGSISHDARLEDYGADNRVTAEKIRENLMTHDGGSYDDGRRYARAPAKGLERAEERSARKYYDQEQKQRLDAFEGADKKPADMPAAEPEAYPRRDGTRGGARSPYKPSPSSAAPAPPPAPTGTPFPPGVAGPSGRLGQQFGQGQQGGAGGGGAVAGSFLLGAELDGEIASRARAAGLLSLQISLPEGALKRRFESLDGDASLTVKIIDRKTFVRLDRVAWAGAFALFAAAALVSLRLYRMLFVGFAAVALLGPIMFAGPWAFLFNGLLKGLLLSLAVPAGKPLAKRWSRSRGNPSSGASGVPGAAPAMGLLALAMLALPSAAGAGEPAPPAQQEPIRVLAPYDDPADIVPGEAASVFISRANFERLWAASRDAFREPKHRQAPFLASARLDAKLDAEAKTVHGTAFLQAANRSDYAESLFVSLGGLSLEEPVSDPPGAVAEAEARGLRLMLPAGWSGSVEAKFSSPARVEGLEGGWSVDLPEAGAGSWRLSVPYAGAAPSRPEQARVSERSDAGTVIEGPLREGRLDLAWTAKPVARSAAGSVPGGGPFSAKIVNAYQWNTLAEATWNATVALEAAAGSASLPEEIVFPVDPGLRVADARGEALVAATIEPGALRLRLAEGETAEIVVMGFIPPPPAGAETWTAAALRSPEGVNATGEVAVAISDRVEIDDLAPKNLRPLAAPTVAGFSTRRYRPADSDWSLALKMRRGKPEFSVRVEEVLAPARGFARRAARVLVDPRGQALRELTLTLPESVRAGSVEGPDVAGWTRLGDKLRVSFSRPLAQPSAFTVMARGDLPAGFETLAFQPLEVEGAGQAERRVAVLVPIDLEIAETGFPGGARSTAPTREQVLLLGSLLPAGSQADGTMSAWELFSAEAAGFSLRPTQAEVFASAYNVAAIAEGRKTLQALLVVEPRRGRAERAEARLLLPEPDAGAASRLQATGPLRDMRTEAVSDTELRVTVEFDAPKSGPATIRFELEQPAETSGAEAVRPAAILPAGQGASISYLVVRRAFEGEMLAQSPGGAKPVDRSRVSWPSDPMFQARPSDLAYEIPPGAGELPAFGIERHARDDTLRAIADALRERVIVTEDGFERRELDIYLQNQSEQFLKIGLPHPRSEVAVQETLVNGQPSKWFFDTADGREALVVPLIRAGLLEPELHVRVAYTAEGKGAFRKSGGLAYELPDLLGGVPVSQSSLTLSLPRSHKYSDFDGSLDKVELVDIQADEARRLAKSVEKLSVAVLQADEATQALALGKLNERKDQVDTKIAYSRSNMMVHDREQSRLSAQGKAADEQERKLASKRTQTLREAEMAQRNVFSNIAKLEKQTAQAPRGRDMAQAIAPPEPEPPKRRVARLEFPLKGEVFAFRQLQGTGRVTLDHIARETRGVGLDMALGAGLIGAAALLAFASGWVFASRRRAGVILFVLCLALAIAQVMLDLTIPGLLVGVWLSASKPAGASEDEPGTA